MAPGSPSSYPLQSLNTFNVSASAASYIRLNSLKYVKDLCTAVDLNKGPFYILGGGSNTLFVGDFPGLILHVQLLGIEVIEETSSRVLIRAGAGVSWHQLVLFCVEKGYGGIENLSLIPGTVGGACVQNIGAYGVELQDVLDSVQAVELSTGKETTFKPSACGFAYRSSFFKSIWQNRYLITSITLALHKEQRFSLEYAGIRQMLERMQVKQLSFRAVSDAVIAIRQQKLPDPAVLGNAGSFFQNPFISRAHYQRLKQRFPSLVAFEVPDKEVDGNEAKDNYLDNESGDRKRKEVKISAGWLIEAAGFKGLRKSDAAVYALHALILVNYGGASGEDVLMLAREIKEKVKNQFDISLTPEVTIVGGAV